MPISELTKKKSLVSPCIVFHLKNKPYNILVLRRQRFPEWTDQTSLDDTVSDSTSFSVLVYMQRVWNMQPRAL